MPRDPQTTDIEEFWAKWCVDAFACATQDRRFLKGDEAEDTDTTEVLYLNVKKAIKNALEQANARQ